MLKNTIVALATTIIVALGVTFQIFGTTSHEVKDGEQTHEQTTPTPAAPAQDETTDPGTPTPDPASTETTTPDEREGSETNNQTGEPGEAPKG